jgi:hypothetical protein
MQGFEVAGLYVLVAIVVVALRHRIPDLLAAPLAVRLAAAGIIGILLALPLLLRGRNLVPDRLEWWVVAAVVIGLVVLVARFRR